MSETYSGALKGVGLQILARLKPIRQSQREDIKLNGNRITLLDPNNRVKDESEVFQVFPPRSTNSEIYDSQLRQFTETLLQGLNIGIFAFGATGAGKSYTFEGSKAEPGVTTLFVQGLFAAINEKMLQNNSAEKRSQGGSYSCSVRMQFVEIVDEEATDLLGKSEALSIGVDEWEGPTVFGAERKPIANEQQFAEYYAAGVQNRTTLANEFGKLSDKAATVLTIEVVQNTCLGEDTQVLVSRAIFADLPGDEVLIQDPETLRIKQGNTLNQGILGVQAVITDIASGTRDFTMYETSILTRLCKDVFGGNTIGIAIFNIQYDDQIGSSVTLKFIKHCQQIINFPIVNDNRSICLMRKYRLEANSLRQMLSGSGGEVMEKYQLKLDELEKQLIDSNLGKLKVSDEQTQATSQVQSLREKYNALVKEKIDVQKELLASEEAKVDLSKALLELQIDNTKLKEQLQNSQFGEQTKQANDEVQGLDVQLQLEGAQKATAELQEELKRVIEDKKELEIEFVALKKNFLNKTGELEEQKRRCEQMAVELINLTNENKALASGSIRAPGDHGAVNQDYESAMAKIKQLTAESSKLREEMVKLTAELEKTKNEKTKAQIAAERIKVEYEDKQVQLEKEYINMSKRTGTPAERKELVGEPESPLKKLGKEQWEKDKFSYQRKCRELTRKLEAATNDLQETKTELQRLHSEKASVVAELEDLRASYRDKLGHLSIDKATAELVATYKDKEYGAKVEIETLEKRVAALQERCRVLRDYSRELRSVAEDLLPEGEMRPSVLAKPEPQAVKEEKDVKTTKKLGGTDPELQFLREENAKLKNELKMSKIDGQGSMYAKKRGESESDIQIRILEELKALKGDQKTITRPGTASAEVEALRKERNQLLEENRKLKQFMEQDAIGPTSGGNIKQLKQRIFYMENTIKDLEKERSELKVRATMAEQQLTTLQEHYNKSTHDYQRKINELKKRDI